MGWGEEVEGDRDLRKKAVVIDSWEDKVLGKSKSRTPVEGIVLLPLGKKKPQGQFICFGLITKTLLAELCDLKIHRKQTHRGKSSLQHVTTIVLRTLNYKSMSDLKGD